MRTVYCVVCDEATNSDNIDGWSRIEEKDELFAYGVCPDCVAMNFETYLEWKNDVEQFRYDNFVEHMGELDCNARDSSIRLNMLYEVTKAWKVLTRHRLGNTR